MHPILPFAVSDNPTWMSTSAFSLASQLPPGPTWTLLKPNCFTTLLSVLLQNPPATRRLWVIWAW